MKRLAFFVAFLCVTGCGGTSEKPSNVVSKEPVSVRGWIDDVEGSARSPILEVEAGRRQQIFAATQIWVDGAEYVSGGVAPNGAFILLDVPPGNVTINFNAPGAEQARLVMKNIPGNADVLVPSVVLRNGEATVVDPAKVKVRIAANVSKVTPENRTAIVAGRPTPIVDVPLGQLVDRHDYPEPVGFRPLATVK